MLHAERKIPGSLTQTTYPEQMFGIKKAGVDFGRRLVAQAHHKDLSGGVPGGCRLGGLYLGKQLVERIQ